MDIIKSVFQRKAVVRDKLPAYGFTYDSGVYAYHTILPGSGFKMTVTITPQGQVSASVIDPAVNEPYTLHLVNDAAGSFVGGLRSEYEQTLRDVADKCFEPDIFKSVQAKELIRYVRDTYGDEPEYLWTKFPDNAVWRRKDTGKWYGALLSVSTSKLGISPGKMAEIIDLRIQPEKINALIDQKIYFPGWHMNKKNWYTIVLDESVSFEELCQRIDESYKLAVK